MIPRLEDISLGRRVLLTVIFIAAVLLLLWLLELGIAQEQLAAQERRASESIIECADEDVRDSLRAITYESLDIAFKDRINHLFSVWMRDDTDQPKRFLTGARMSLRGYIQGRHIISTWNPKPCPK